MMHEAKNNQWKFDPDNFSALQDFFGGYLHEDFGEEYGSAAEALLAFLSDASGDEIQNVKEEWQRLRAVLKDQPLAETQAALHRLGAAWQPLNEAELKTLDEILSKA
jgi:predicted ArsR family transcriptional regulator